MDKVRAKILVVDDEPIFTQLVSHLLTADGYEVDTAVDGIDALDKIRGKKYDLLLTGIRMPGISGFELYECAIKIAPCLANKTIVISGSIDSADTKEFLAKYKLPYFAKPFISQQLVNVVNSVLNSEKVNWFGRHLNMKTIMKLLKGAGTGGLYVGQGTLYILFSIVQFAVPAVTGLAVIWSAIQLFTEGSIIWGLVVLLIGTPIAVGLASWAATFLFFIGIIAAIIWGIITLFGFDVSFGSVMDNIWLGITILFIGGIVFAVVSSLFKGKMNWFQRHLNWTLVLAYLLWFILNAGESVMMHIMAWFAAIFLLTLSGWVLIRKGRNLWWLLLAPVCSPLWLKNNKGKPELFHS